MPRQLRHHTPGGWYHITTRGLGRRELFHTDRDREHFVELLEGMVERYRIILHAYVLMVNHYHLLIESPEGNVSRALQWLNTSYSVWHNIKHGCAGALFQSRFKSIPIDSEGSWALECSLYVHLNPVRLKKLGQGKDDRRREKQGMLPEEPSKEQILKRLETLRSHPWSSYPAYAGYVEPPTWLTCAELWRRCTDKGKDPKKEYREWIEDYVRQGIVEGAFAKLSTAVAVGSAEFIAKLRRQVLKRKGENTNERDWRKLLPFPEVMAAVGSVRGEPWENFVNRYGDWGRDLALYIGRVRCGLTLKELGNYADMNAASVSQGAIRIRKLLSKDKMIATAYRKTLRLLGEKKV
jgi:REP element-mobilizing transposase RayT